MSLDRSIAHLIEHDNVCIDLYPSLDTDHPIDEKNQFTLGDAHGNALNLIHFLVRQNVLVLSEEEYRTIVAIYKKGVLTKKDLSEFNRILESAEVNPVGTIRLIGDEVSDRGNNDYYTLKILEILDKKGVKVEILFSNHGLEFIEAYEKMIRYNHSRLIPPRMNPVFSKSLRQLQKLIDQEIVSRLDILEMIKKYYKPKLKALSYTVNQDKSKISIYNHAPIDLRVIQALAKKVGLEYRDSTLELLTQTIDQINDSFSMYVKSNSVHELIQHSSLLNAYYGNEINPDEEPYLYLIWNRAYSKLKREEKHPSGNYSIDYVHGHDLNGPLGTNIYCMDGYLGKTIKDFKGLYRVHFSQEQSALELISEAKSSEEWLDINLYDETMYDEYESKDLSTEIIVYSEQSEDKEDKNEEMTLIRSIIEKKDIDYLHTQINEISKYGEHLLSSDFARGLTTMNLANKLEHKFDAFLNSKAKTNDLVNEISNFSDSFESLLHSEDKAMIKYSETWTAFISSITIALRSLDDLVLASKLREFGIFHGKMTFFSKNPADNNTEAYNQDYKNNSQP